MCGDSILVQHKYSSIVANGTAHYCKLKQGSKIVLFNSNTLIGFTKVFCIFMRNKELYYIYEIQGEQIL
jgi:hypothetical protein